MFVLNEICFKTIETPQTSDFFERNTCFKVDQRLVVLRFLAFIKFVQSADSGLGRGDWAACGNICL